MPPTSVGTLDDVVKARSAAMSAQGPGQVAAAENQLSGALGRLIALSEAYPDLKANANFQQLASELADLEKQDRRQPSLLQQRRSGIQHRHPADARRPVRRHVRVHPQGFLRPRRQPRRRRAGADGKILNARGFVQHDTRPFQSLRGAAKRRTRNLT